MPRWTPEARAAQAERIRAQKPWLKTTGPKTPDGKARVSRNAVKHGARSAEMIAVCRYLKAQKLFIRRIRAQNRLARAGRLAEMRAYKTLKHCAAFNNRPFPLPAQMLHIKHVPAPSAGAFPVA